MSALLAGLLGRLKLPLLYVAIGAVVVIGAYRTGVNAERRAGEAAALRLELETIRADKRLGEQAAISAADKAMTLAAREREQLEDQIARREALAARPESERNPATDADLDLIYGRPQ